MAARNVASLMSAPVTMIPWLSGRPGQDACERYTGTHTRPPATMGALAWLGLDAYPRIRSALPSSAVRSPLNHFYILQLGSQALLAA